MGGISALFRATKPDIQSRFWAGLICVALLSGCAATIGGAQDGDKALVRHHFGYVREVAPATQYPTEQIFSTNATALGVWFDLDSRPWVQGARGIGLGVGGTSSRREIYPLDCRFAVRVERAADVEAIVELFENSNLRGEGLCVTSQSSD